MIAHPACMPSEACLEVVGWCVTCQVVSTAPSLLRLLLLHLGSDAGQLSALEGLCLVDGLQDICMSNGVPPWQGIEERLALAQLHLGVLKVLQCGLITQLCLQKLLLRRHVRLCKGKECLKRKQRAQRLSRTFL